jgi:hypothetical protein
LWKAHLDIDDWDSVLDSLVLTDEESPHVSYLSADDGALQRGLNIVDVTDNIHRMAGEGAIFSDPDLRAAVVVWNIVRSSLPDFETSEISEVDELASAAFFRVNASRVTEALVLHALDEVGGNEHAPNDLIGFIVSGPAYWSKNTLIRVGNYLAESVSIVLSVVPLLKLIAELDARGSGSLTRKLLDRIPPNLDIRDVGPDGIADVVRLSRRYRIPEVLSRCIDISTITVPVIDRLSIEDISWMFSSGGFSEGQIKELRRLLWRDGRCQRAAEIVARFTSEFLRDA